MRDISEEGPLAKTPLCFVQEPQILQICYNVEHFSDILFLILICNNVVNIMIGNLLK